MPAPGNFGQLLGLGGGSPDVNYDQINALLQQFGGLSVQPPKPIGLAENTGWGQQHPGLSGGIDNALITLANMGPSGRTTGDNISNVARGLQSIGPTRYAQGAAQLALPLQMAGQIGGLQKDVATAGRENAMAQYYSGRNDTAEAVALERARASNENARMRAEASSQGKLIAAGKDRVLLKDGSVGEPFWNDDTNQIDYKSNPNIDPKSIKQAQTQKQLGGGVEGAIIAGRLGTDPDNYQRRNAMGKVVAKGPSAYWEDADKIYSNHKAIAPSVGAQGASDRQVTGNWNKDQGDLFKGLMDDRGKSAQTRVEGRAMELLGTTKDPGKAMQQAQQEEDDRKGKVMGAYGQFGGMSEQEQRQQGGIMGYLGKQGYDIRSHTFSTPRTGAPSQQAPGANSSMSPAVSKFLDLLKN